MLAQDQSAQPQSAQPQSAQTGLASEFPDGAWLVELSGLHDPELLPDTVATGLGLAGMTRTAGRRPAGSRSWSWPPW